MNAARASIVGGLVLLAGCIPKFHEPELRLDAVRLGAVGLHGGTLVAMIVVANPNAYELRSADIRYAIAVNDAGRGERAHWLEIANGSVDHEVRVGASDSTLVEVPVDFTYSAVGGAIRSVLSTGSFEYRLSGDLRVTAPIRRFVPFRHSGRVDITSTLTRPE